MDEDQIAEGLKEFSQVMIEAGFHLQSGDSPNILSVPGSVFQLSLREHLTGNNQDPGSIDSFVSQCGAFFNSQENFIKALHSTKDATILEDSTVMIKPQDSLVRLLLNMEEVQPKLMLCILQRFAEASKEERRKDSAQKNLQLLILSKYRAFGSDEKERQGRSEPDLSALVLSQLVGLDTIANPSSVAGTLFQVLRSCSTATPHRVTSGILNVLNEISLPTNEAAELRRKVVKRIHKVPLETVPVLLKFVFERAGEEESSLLIRQVRLNFDRAFSCSSCLAQNQNSKETDESIAYLRKCSYYEDARHTDCLSLAFKSILAALKRSNILADTWFKELESKNLQCVDLLVLLLMEDKSSQHERTVEHIFKRKFLSGSISADLLEQAFKLYGAVSEPDFSTLILSQLAGLNSIANSGKVASTLLQVLNSCSTATPYRVTNGILKVLSVLDLSITEEAELRQKVVKRIVKVPLETVSLLLTFVFERAGEEEYSRLIHDVRLFFDRAFSRSSCLERYQNFKETAEGNLYQRNCSYYEETRHNDCLSLAIESLQAALKRSNTLADTWFKVIREELERGNLLCIDLLILLLMEHKWSQHGRTIELIFKRKLLSGSISADLVKDAFKLYGLVLKKYFNQLWGVVDFLLLHSKDTVFNSCGSILFSEMFGLMDDSQQRNVVNTTIENIGYGHSGSGGVSQSLATVFLAVLQRLAETQMENLVKHSDLTAAFVKRLRGKRCVNQTYIKKVMQVLCKIAFGYPESYPSNQFALSSLLQLRLRNLVRKQLESSSSKLQKVGVVGAVHLVGSVVHVRWMGLADLRFAEIPKEKRHSLVDKEGITSGKRRMNIAKDVLGLVKRCTERDPEVAGLFMDEMAGLSLLDEMHPNIRAQLFKNVSRKILNSFFVFGRKEPLDGFPVKFKFQLGLNTPPQPDKLVSANIGPMTFKEAHQTPGGRSYRKASFSSLASHFRLLRLTMDPNAPATLGIAHTLLASVLCLPDDDVLVPDIFDSLRQPVKDAVCRSFFHAVNWLIELINTFASAKPMRAKVIQRVRDVSLLKEKFLRSLARNPSFLPSVIVGEFLGHPPATLMSTDTARLVKFQKLDHSLVFQALDFPGCYTDAIESAETELYLSLRWMFKFHPNTLLSNLVHLAEKGRWDVLLWLVQFGFTGQTGRLSQLDVTKQLEQKLDPNLDVSKLSLQEMIWMVVDVPDSKTVWNKYLAHLPDNLERERARIERQFLTPVIRTHRREEKTNLRQRCVNMLQEKKILKLVYETVSQLFAQGLKSEENASATSPVRWLPKIGGVFDITTGLGRSIAVSLYGNDRVQAANESTEKYENAAWESYSLKYFNQLQGRIVKREFPPNEEELFAVTVDSILLRKQISYMLPLEIIDNVIKHGGSNVASELEEVWNRHVRAMKEFGVFDGAVSIYDYGSPFIGNELNAALTLSLLVAAVSKAPFDGLVFSLSTEARQVHEIQQPTLMEKVDYIRHMACGVATDLQAVLNLILKKADEAKLPPNDMVRTMFIFSNEEFDQRIGKQSEADYMLIQRKYMESGYQLPDIVYWNMNGGSSKDPVTKHGNLTLVSGFSPRLLHTFMESGKFD